MTEREYSRIMELTLKSLEDQISEDEFAELDSYVSSSRQNARFFAQCIATCMEMTDHHKIVADKSCFDNALIDQDLWDELAEYEKSAPVVEVSEEAPTPILIEKVVREKASYKFSRSNVFSLILSVAAILLIVAFLHFAPDRSSVEVATVLDKMEVKFSNSGVSYEQESRIYSNDLVSLSKGLLEIQTDRGVTLTVEGPAEFEFTKEADVSLYYGRVYASVSPQGIGFVVNTPNSKIIDLGTEFGVKTNVDGQTELHVIKGKTTLVTGGTWLDKNSETVLQEQARQVSLDGTQVKDIPVESTAFARSIHSDTQTVWRGQKTLDLADIVGGGNGLGTGVLGSGINAATGIYTTEPTSFDFPRVVCRYNPVQVNPFIDGVFVPNGSEGPVVLNSAGQTYDAFASTRGDYRTAITYGPAIRDRQKYPERNNPLEFYLYELTMAGTVYGTLQNPAIYVHSNAGLTFDLDEIRNHYANATIGRFEAVCGIPENVIKLKPTGNPKYEMSVFVDGQCLFTKQFDRSHSLETVSVPISSTSTFLTLVVLDSDLLSDYDWCLLGQPVLTLE